MPTENSGNNSSDSHFGRKSYTILSNICTKANLIKLSYQNAINKYLDQDTAQRTTLKPEDKWEDCGRNDTGAQVNKTNAIGGANERQL